MQFIKLEDIDTNLIAILEIKIAKKKQELYQLVRIEKEYDEVVINKIINDISLYEKMLENESDIV